MNINIISRHLSAQSSALFDIICMQYVCSIQPPTSRRQKMGREMRRGKLLNHSPSKVQGPVSRQGILVFLSLLNEEQLNIAIPLSTNDIQSTDTSLCSYFGHMLIRKVKTQLK